MPTPVPPALSPFIQSPGSGSLTLITSVLDTTSNWLLLRYIYAALCPEKRYGHITTGTGVTGGTGENTVNDKNADLRVMLISFLRPFEIWREMAKKIVNIFVAPIPSHLIPSHPVDSLTQDGRPSTDATQNQNKNRASIFLPSCHPLALTNPACSTLMPSRNSAFPPPHQPAPVFFPTVVPIPRFTPSRL